MVDWVGEIACYTNAKKWGNYCAFLTCNDVKLNEPLVSTFFCVFPQVKDHYSYNNTTNLVAQSLWFLDALLYLIE